MFPIQCFQDFSSVSLQDGLGLVQGFSVKNNANTTTHSIRFGARLEVLRRTLSRGFWVRITYNPREGLSCWMSSRRDTHLDFDLLRHDKLFLIKLLPNPLEGLGHGEQIFSLQTKIMQENSCPSLMTWWTARAAWSWCCLWSYSSTGVVAPWQICQIPIRSFSAPP